MRNGIAACVFGILLLAPTSVWAVHPFQVENTDTQGAGKFLFELNGDYSRLRTAGMKTTDLSGVMTAGTSDNTDVSLEVPYLLLDPSPVTGKYENGVGDVLLKLKYRTYENEVKQSAGFQLYSSLPTGDVEKGLGTHKVLTGLQVMDQQECHGNILHVSAGYEVLGGHFSANYAFRYGLALEHKLTESFRLLTELAGEIRKSSDSLGEPKLYSNPVTFMAGFKYDLSRSWYADLALRAGLNKDAEDYTTLAGTAWRF